MKVNIYDFDKTIYDGDSSIDFFFFCARKNYIVFLYVPKIIIFYVLYSFKLKTKKQLKEVFFSYLNLFKNINLVINEFWDKNQKKIKKFYLEKNHNDDIIISASPNFLLEPICKKLGVKDLIATEMKKETGKIVGENCRGEEKVKRFRKSYPKVNVKEVYTDSISDMPIINLGEQAFFIKKEVMTRIK